MQGDYPAHEVQPRRYNAADAAAAAKAAAAARNVPFSAPSAYNVSSLLPLHSPLHPQIVPLSLPVQSVQTGSWYAGAHLPTAQPLYWLF